VPTPGGEISRWLSLPIAVVAMTAMVLGMVVIGLLANQLVLYTFAIPLVAVLLGTRSGVPAMRWLGAVGVAAFAWIGVWAFGLLLVFTIGLGIADSRGRGPEPWEYSPAIVPAVLGPIAGVLVLRSLLRRTEPGEPTAPILVPGWGPTSQAGAGMLCGKCGRPLSPVWKGRCQHCGAQYVDHPPVPRA
jgi:hypothetical protein